MYFASHGPQKEPSSDTATYTINIFSHAAGNNLSMLQLKKNTCSAPSDPATRPTVATVLIRRLDFGVGFLFVWNIKYLWQYHYREYF